jgi:hypothetical protein
MDTVLDADLIILATGVRQRFIPRRTGAEIDQAS